MPQVITALDIGSSHIKCAVAERGRGGTARVVSAFTYPSSGVRKGVIVDEDEILSVVRGIIVDVSKISRSAAHCVVVSIGGAHIRSVVSHAAVAVSRADREIQQDDVDRVIQEARVMNKRQANYQILHDLVSQFFVDDVGEIRDPVRMSGNRIAVDLTIVEAFQPYVNALMGVVKKAGGKVDTVIFAPLAAGKGVLSRRQCELGVMVLDIGYGTASFTVYKEGKMVYAGSIPIGSGNITNDVAIGLRIPVDTAERLKIEYGSASSSGISRREKILLADMDPSAPAVEISRKLLAEIIEVRVDEMLELVHNEVASVDNDIQLPAGVVLTGGGAKLEGIDEAVKKKLKLPVSMGYPDVSSLSIGDPSDRACVEDVQFATAVGLISDWEDTSKKKVRGSLWNKVKGVFHNLTP